MTYSKAPLNIEPSFVTLTEAGQILALGITSIYKLVKSGDLPVIKLGRASRVRLADVRRYAESVVPVTNDNQSPPEAA